MAVSRCKIRKSMFIARYRVKGFLSLFIPLLFFVGCHHEPWHHSFIRNSNFQHDLAKLSYTPSNPHQGIELEIIRHGKEIYAYVNVKQHKFACYDNNPYQTLLTITTDHDTQTFVIPLLEGGQRAHLTTACLGYLLQVLKNHPSVTLSAGYFSEQLNTTNFTDHYNSVVKQPYPLLPEQLINFAP